MTNGTTTRELIDVDPTELVIGTNVRLDPRLDRRFIASIRERGVLEAITAHRDDDGHLVVQWGQRRTLAAVQAARPTVPVIVVPRPQDADRVIDQLAENDHRAALTTGERAVAFEQLTTVGLSAAQIAKRTATTRRQVDAGLIVAGNELAREAVDRWDFLTLDQAAVLAEFEDDDQAVTRLVQAAHAGHGWDHLVQRLRDDRTEAVERAELVASLTAEGVSVIDRPNWNDVATDLDQLTHDGQPVTPDTHSRCPGHAAYVIVDWQTPDLDPADEDQNATHSIRVLVPGWVCTNPIAHGHTNKWGAPATGGAPLKVADMNEDERDAARAHRRDVIASNKAWDSAQTVRRDWLRTFLTRKTAPKGATGHVAATLAACPHALTQALTTGHQLAGDLLGLTVAGRTSTALTKAVETASDDRRHVVILALILAASENATGRHSWRTVDTDTTRHLRFLESVGYELSNVELRACGQTPSLSGIA